jgi:hypothetical protein
MQNLKNACGMYVYYSALQFSLLAIPQAYLYILSLIKDLFIMLQLRPGRVQLANNSQVSCHSHLAIYCSFLLPIRYNVKRLNSHWSGCTAVTCFCGPRQQVLLFIMQFTQSEFSAVEHRWRASENWLYICSDAFFFLEQTSSNEALIFLNASMCACFHCAAL